MSEDVWHVLGIDRGSTADEVKRAYRTLLKRTKPESDPEGFRRLREAYERALERVHFRVAPAPLLELPSALETADPGESIVDGPAAPPLGAAPCADGPAESPEPPESIESFYARFDATDATDVDARLAVALDAGARFPGDAMVGELVAEAVDAIEDPERRRAELRRARDARVPGIDRVLLYQEPQLLAYDDLERVVRGTEPYLRNEAMVHIARRGHAERALELARTLVAETESSTDAADPRFELVVTGLELFANAHPAAGREVESLVRQLDGRLRPLRGDFLTSQLAYLRELSAPRLSAQPSLLVELALEVLGPRPGRARPDADPDVLRRGRRWLDASPSLAALVDSRAPAPPSGLGGGRRGIDKGGFGWAGFAIFGALQLLRMMLRGCDDDPVDRTVIRTPTEYVAAANLPPPDAAEMSVLERHLRVALVGDGGVAALCGDELRFCYSPRPTYACVEPTGAFCIDGAEAVRAAVSGDCATARDRLLRIVSGGAEPVTLGTFERVVWAVIDAECPGAETGSAP